jgi:transposase
MRTIELGVTITDAVIDDKSTTIFCTPVARNPRCRTAGVRARYRDTVTRSLTDLPVAAVDFGRTVFNQDLGKRRRRGLRRRGVVPGMCCGDC